MLRARLYGGLSVQVDDRAVPDPGGTRPRSLLAYLLLHPGRHPRARLAGIFWPDVLDTSARGSLRSALWAVRAALDAAGGADLLASGRTEVGFEPGPLIHVDALEVEELLAAGDIASLERAVALADGPLLVDVADEWALEAQDRQRERLIDALILLADAADRRGEPDTALARTREALSRDRLREPTHRALMRRLAAAGDRAGALAVYRRCAQTLAGELGVAPTAPTRELADRIRAGDLALGPSRAPPDVATMRMGLLGRGRDLARLEAARAHAVAGHGGVVFVTGVAGVGKSRLVAEVLDRARAAGALTATGHAADIDGPPYALWSDLLRGLVLAVPAPAGETGWPAEIARLCPAAERAWGLRPGPAAHEPGLARIRLFEAVAEMLHRCAESAPCVLLLEDVHMAGGESLALLAHISARLGGRPVMILATARTRAATAALDRVRAAVERGGALLDELHLPALSSEEIGALVRAAAPALTADAIARVVDVARGNPLLALRSVRSVEDGGDPRSALRDALRGPMAGLSPAAAGLVAAVAAAGRPLGVPEAAALATGPALDGACAEGIAAGLFDPAAEPRVAFVHDLVRAAVYEGLSARERRAAHAQVARMLTGSGTDMRSPAEVAHHLRHAGEAGRAHAHLMAAARAARALGALDRAAGHLRDAARCAADAGSPGAEGEAWIALAEVEAWRGDRPAVDAAFARGRALLEAVGDVVGLADALAERARWFRTTTCYPAEVLRSGREALDLLDRAGAAAPETRLLALAGMAWGEAVAGDPRRAAALHEHLGHLLVADGDPALRSEHLAARGYALLRAGDATAARTACADAAAVADTAGRWAHALDARIGEAACAAALGDIEGVLAVLAEAPDPVRTGPGLACQHWATRAHALSRLGRHAEAEAAAREQLETARRAAIGVFEAAAQADLGLTLLASGRGRDALAELEAVLDDPSARLPRAALRLSAVEAALATGDIARARAHMDAFPFEPVRAGDTPAILLARLDGVAGRMCIAGGDAPGAVSHLDAAAERWRRLAQGPVPGAATGDAIIGSMIDLGRPPVAGVIDIDAELGRLDDERRRARSMAAAGAGRA